MSKKSLVLSIVGMHCTSCVAKIEKRVSSLPGISSISVSFATEEGKIEFDDRVTSLKAVLQAIQDVGYKASEKIKETKHAGSGFLYFSLVVSLAGAIALFINMMAMLVGHPLLSLGTEFSISFFVQIIGGSRFYYETYKAARKRNVTMDTLVSLGTTIAFLYSSVVWLFNFHEHAYFETNTMILAFILIGRVMEKRTINRARRGMQALVKMQAKEAYVHVDGKAKRVPIEEVEVDHIVVIKPGGSIPVDGKVVKGHSHIDESMISGESVAVYKEVDSLVFAGTINQEGAIHVSCMKRGRDTLLGKMIQLVEEAQSSKPKIQKLVDRIASVFVPVVLGIALATLILWIVLERNVEEGILSGIAVLIIACPCSIGLATPIAVMLSASRCAKRGILVKDFVSLETVGTVKHMVLDKTGTITRGVVSIVSTPSSDEVVHLASILARYSSHPLSEAIASQGGEATEVAETPGKGIQGRIEGKLVSLGSLPYLANQGVKLPPLDQDRTAVYVAVDKTFEGAYTFEDELLPDAKKSIHALKALSIQLHLISGDHANAVRRVAKSAGIDHYRGGVSPEGKGTYISSLKGSVAMVGDGINDALALAKADVGIAVSNGTDIAMETASIALLHQKCKILVDLVKISRGTKLRIVQNLILGFGYNVLAIPLAGFGLLNPIIASIVMSLSSICVVLNSLRPNR